ncbi:MAG: ComF family protein [Hyphomonadaceae bacterium]|nr:ComF family protein [Hyphomonadaceae bacterium]
MEKTSPGYVAASAVRDKPRRRHSRAGGLAGLIWPQRSLITGREVAGPGALEPELWAKLQFLSDPLCQRCGTPFDIAVDDAQVCGACLANSPVYDRARAALVYGDVSRDLVLGLKYQGRRDSLALLGGWMTNAGAGLLADADLIVPVPLHYLRLVRRGFNQSVWLAAAISRSSGVDLSVDALKRIKSTPIQGGLSADGRRRNVQGAFRVRKGREARIRDKKILLIDDVLTTGATAEACSRALKRAGASCVDVLTLARVAAPRGIPI